jgi:hypothetical protein
MAKIFIPDFFVIETLGRLDGAANFLEVVDKAISELEWKERQSLKQSAEEEKWDDADYEVERQVLDWKFGEYVRRLAAYSGIILLHSIVETQLMAYAERVGRQRGETFRVKHVEGRYLEQAALYLKRLMSLDVTQDPTWQCLRDLRALRNAVVHRGGKRGKGHEQQRAIDGLIQEYPGKVSLLNHTIYGEEIWISMHLCREFALEIEGFFKRLFKAAGLRETGGQHEI